MALGLISFFLPNSYTHPDTITNLHETMSLIIRTLDDPTILDEQAIMDLKDKISQEYIQLNVSREMNIVMSVHLLVSKSMYIMMVQGSHECTFVSIKMHV